MSETQAAYSVALPPGRELDALVARVMGWEYIIDGEGQGWVDLDGTFIDELWTESLDAPSILPPKFSTNPDAAIKALKWYEENDPWKDYDPMVLHRLKLSTFVFWTSDGRDKTYYPHAIALAVAEAGKALGVIDI